MGVLRKRFFSLDESTGGFSLERFSVKAPAWAKPGDTIEIEAGTSGLRYMVTVPSSAGPGESFEVDVPKPREVASDATAQLPLPLRVVCTCCPTIWTTAIWTLVTGNYVVHGLLRPVVHHPAMWVLGHAVLFLQLGCYLRCQLTHPGTITKEWQSAAAAGDEEHETCKRTGLLLPPRSRYVGKAGCIVLGFDHHCFWLGTPIGLRNRRFFVSFLWWSVGLVLFGLSLVLYDVWAFLPAHMAASLDAKGVDIEERRRHMHRAFGGHVGHAFGGGGANFADAMLGRNVFTSMVWDSPGIMEMALAGADVSVVYITLLMGVGALDFTALILLGIFATWQTSLVRHNRTTLDSSDEFDVGTSANWRQVMGNSRLAWFLPILGDGPAADGLRWPRNPSLKDE